MTIDNEYTKYDPNNVNLIVVVTKAFGLSFLFLVNFTILMLHLFGFYKISTDIVTLNLYLIFLTIFHLLEFYCTCIFNNKATDDDSFILNDFELLLCYVLSIIEHALRCYLFPVVSYKALTIAVVLCIAGQVSRSIAMCTAKESFNHYIQVEHDKEHKLVTNGIYKTFRHPSYFGFFWWFVGTEILLGNIICLIFGIVKLQAFFKKRIDIEEEYLTFFFAENYTRYKEKTIIGIPFLSF